MRISVLDPMRPCVLALSLIVTGCGGGKSDEKADEKSAEKGDEKADEGGGDEAAASAEDEGAPAVPSTTAEPPDTGAADGAGETGAADGAGEEAGAEGGAAAAETGAAASPEDQIKALFEEIGNKKTKDDRALAALEEAKGLGAEPKELAKTANKRGEKLLTNPDRATPFFEWAQTADPKYPNATFNLAKLAANTGDIVRVKELLTEVKARGGKKLLQQVEFDPAFALVADDPEVLSLLR